VKALRDRAIIRVLGSMALRRHELTSLRIGDVDLDAGKLSILGKGRIEREVLTIPRATKEALAAYMAAREADGAPGATESPLWVNCAIDGSPTDEALGDSGLYYIIRHYGEVAGIGHRVHPHSLRHGAITEVVRRKGDLVAAQAFSRHSNVATLNIYLHASDDAAGKMAEEASDSLDN
jgi:integrase/recombinase XerC